MKNKKSNGKSVFFYCESEEVYEKVKIFKNKVDFFQKSDEVSERE